VKQILQHLRTGRIELAEVPCPLVRPGHLLVRTVASLISPGTERMLVEFGQAGWIGKARAQPERVRQVLTKIRTDGALPTLEAVFSRLDEPLPLGYCNVGRVLEVGSGVEGFAIGDRVVSNGAHAEMVCVPATLAARIPADVADEAASFAVLGAIALNGIRLLEPTLGESVAVVGLGLLGMLAAQLLRTHGCRVIGIDVDPVRSALARTFGCEIVPPGTDPVRAAREFSLGRGMDAVLITASARTNEIVHQAAEMSRKRGRIVLVGVVGLNLQRADFYEKELSFQVACSYGPGRHDAHYESGGHDYPLPFVRWTAARNFEAVLDALVGGGLVVEPLISRRYAHRDAAAAYDAIVNDSTALGIALSYPAAPEATGAVVRLQPAVVGSSEPARPVVGVIGTGSFARQVLLPAITGAGAAVRSVASAGGVTSLHAGRKYGAVDATTDYRHILDNDEINTVFIATRHDTHARLACEALAAGKHVFVEKPLAIDTAGIELVRRAYGEHPHRQLMVGFNRRFAPHAVAARQLLTGRAEPIALRIMVNAGEVAADHWVDDPAVGGGRIIGEACHFIDLGLYLVGSPITTVQAVRMDSGGTRGGTLSINLGFADGSIATILYWANGPRSYPKEHVEIFSSGRVLAIENWRALRAFEWRGAARMRMRQDKGHRSQVAEFLARIAAGGPPLIPFEELYLGAMATFAALTSAREARVVRLAPTVPSADPDVPLQEALR
jgi:predicted dehydrogenase/threonine dehydrogenase-like Zn-dependent dehydrogenase